MSFNKNAMIEHAVVQLIKYKPFYGHMILNMNVHYVKEAILAGVNVTNSVNLFINPEMFPLLSIEEQIAILEHEVNHLVNTHMTRKGNRDHHKFNVACDIAINQFITNLPSKEKIIEIFHKVYGTPKKELEKIISGVKTPKMYKLKDNLTAEEYYDLLPEDESGEDGDIVIYIDGDGKDGNAGKESEGKGNTKGKIKVVIPKGAFDDHSKWGEKSDLNDDLVKEKIKKLVNKVINSVEAGSIPAHIKNSITELFRTSTKWKQVLQRFMARATLIAQRYSRKRMNRRFGLVFPGSTHDFKLKLAVAIDESGSVGEELSNLFFSEMTRLNLVSPEIWLYQFDIGCSEPKKFRKFQKLERVRSGGTEFTAPIKTAIELGVDALIILTDGQANTDIPKPKLPVLWALDEHNYEDFKPPFGIKIKLEADYKMKTKEIR